MNGVVIAILLVGGVGLFIGLFLGFAGIAFSVKVDAREEKVLEVLPGNNCGGFLIRISVIMAVVMRVPPTCCAHRG